MFTLGLQCSPEPKHTTHPSFHLLSITHSLLFPSSTILKLKKWKNAECAIFSLTQCGNYTFQDGCLHFRLGSIWILPHPLLYIWNCHIIWAPVSNVFQTYWSTKHMWTPSDNHNKGCLCFRQWLRRRLLMTHAGLFLHCVWLWTESPQRYLPLYIVCERIQLVNGTHSYPPKTSTLHSDMIQGCLTWGFWFNMIIDL